jgi:serine/threonine protein kinase
VFTTQTRQSLIGHRYEVKEQVGQGGMGTVYRALDHLTGETVGLKRVTVAADRLQFGHHTHTVSGDSSDRRLALAQEFKVLASLRHPHIISVLDYGFDENRQPFFTMDLLDDTQTIVQAAKDQPLQARLIFLVQTLQALAYLHRRGVLHRDLKPDNVQVYQGQVKVLDFGLAMTAGDAGDSNIVGTMAYIAPEIFQGGVPSQVADLYTVGVIAYEIFAGHRPYDGDEKDRLILNILTKMPDVYALDIPGDVSDVLNRLLSKQPADRYPDANAVIVALCQALQQPLPPETAAIRESFLQAATFVGRESEIGQLRAALRRILDRGRVRHLRKAQPG